MFPVALFHPEPIRFTVRRRQVRRRSLVRGVALAMGLLATFAAVSWGSPAVAQTRAGTPLPATHWYMVPTAANGCQLNLRSGPATGYRLMAHLGGCASGPWCWYQERDCARGTVDEVIGGRYTCLDGQRRAVTSDRWTVVALTSSRWAYVASRCGWARQL